MIPDTIARNDILKALKIIDRRGIAAHRESTKFDILFKQKKYPPKYAISLAYKVRHAKEWPAGYFGGGDETNNFLIARDFVVVDKKGRPIRLQPTTEDEQVIFWEGKRLFAKHRKIERDSRLARRAKLRFIASHGDLYCEVCGFSFQKRYGVRGAGYIEAHHIKPVSRLAKRTRVKIEDLALVCSNCHRMLHRARPWITIAQLRSSLKL